MEAKTYNTGNTDMAGVYNAVAALKKANPGTKAGISVGGWYDSNYFSAGSEDKYRINFAKSLARYADAFGFDNLDIDWEYPTTEHCNEDIPVNSSNEGLEAELGFTPKGCGGAGLEEGSMGYDANNADNFVDCFKETC